MARIALLLLAFAYLSVPLLAAAAMLIAGAIAVAAQRSQDADEIIELIRPELGPLIIQKLCGVREPLRVMTLEGGLEGLLGQAMRSDAAV